jgi:hypothetical protein
MSPNNRLGTKSTKALRSMLTERDMAILRSIFEHRFLTTRQICQLHFHSHASYGSAIRACTRVLARLGGHKLIHKLSRPVGGMGGGSASFIWGIDAAGDRLLKKELPPEEVKRARAFEPTPIFLAHTLAIADARLMLEDLGRGDHIELLDVATEPFNWRPFVARSGQTQTLKPDLYAVTATVDFEDHWFLEIDRGTESIPTLIRKCEHYQRYQATGLEQEAHGVFPVVLWLVPTEARRERFRAAIDSHKRLSSNLFRVAAPYELPRIVMAGGDAPADKQKQGLSS